MFVYLASVVYGFHENKISFENEEHECSKVLWTVCSVYVREAFGNKFFDTDFIGFPNRVEDWFF